MSFHERVEPTHINQNDFRKNQGGDIDKESVLQAIEDGVLAQGEIHHTHSRAKGRRGKSLILHGGLSPDLLPEQKFIHR